MNPGSEKAAISERGMERKPSNPALRGGTLRGVQRTLRQSG